MGLLAKILSRGANADVKRYSAEVAKINALESKMHALTDEQMREKTAELKSKVQSGTPLTEIRDEAFALVREGAIRSLGMRHYDEQLMCALALDEHKIAEFSTGEGKAINIDTPIPTPDGWKTAKDIQIGDLVFGSDGKPTKIVGVYPQPEPMEEYLMTFSDGRQVIAAGNHRWAVYTTWSNTSRAAKNGTTTIVKTTEQMYEKGVKCGHDGDAHRPWRYRIPIAGAADYPVRDLPLDPYVLGAFLGNGCRSKTKALTLSSKDTYVPNRVASKLSAQLGKSVSADKCHPNNHNWVFRFADGTLVHAYDIDESLTAILCETYSYDKAIPEEYLIASISQRQDLLRGLLDTDGCIDDTNRHRVTYSTTSAALADGITQLVRSLGMAATKRVRPANTQEHANHDEIVLRVLCDNEDKPMLFSQPEKLMRAKSAKDAGNSMRKHTDRLPIVSIEKTGKTSEMVCFQVEADDHLFLCGDYIITHNTLACTPAIYLNALDGKGVHVVTVNDYLATRDAAQMGQLYSFLGLTCDCVTNDMDNERRHVAYAADITYGTNTEFGFDYLRDNMVMEAENRVQRGHHFAIVDEVDSILIDEARTPLIISGEGHEDLELYRTFAHAAKQMVEGPDFEMDEKRNTIAATETGLQKMEKLCGIDIYADETGSLVNHLQNALKAQFLFHADKHYIVVDGEVRIVDEFTGRVLPGRRYSEGLHQAIEAKEHVEIQQENETLASITLQNYFRMYEKLSGMTGTAMTEDAEFRKIYNLPVVTIPRHRPNARIDHLDRLYVDMDHKIQAIVDEVKRRNANGQPVLVGTASIEASERISRALTRAGISHQVLNAKHHAQEARIVAQAGRFRAVTVATNMAGRGTDIMLGGNPDMLAADRLLELGYDEENPAPEHERARTRAAAQALCDREQEFVREVGGLAIIGSERHEARRIDNQLRGRAGRQGDPGETQFFLSFDDDLLRLFGDDKMTNAKESLIKSGYDPSEPIEMRSMTALVERAQRRVEEVHFESRKNTLEYDDVVDKQRKTIYAERNAILDGHHVLDDFDSILDQVIDYNVAMWMPEGSTKDEQDPKAVEEWLEAMLPEEATAPSLEGMNASQAHEAAKQAMLAAFKEGPARFGTDKIDALASRIMLRVMDARWRTYLQELDYLKSGIALRSFGQRDPLVEYKREAYAGFETLVLRMYEDFVRTLLHMRLVVTPAAA